MRIKPLSFASTVMVLLVLLRPAMGQQCAIARTGLNLCNSGQTSYLSNTSNTITIYEAGTTTVTGTYNVTISYYDQGTNACAPQIACTGTVSSSGTITTITLSGCSALPDLSATGIIYIDLQSAANSYFFHIYGGACILPLPIVLSSFSLQRNGNTISVMWTTAQESNASGVYIERNSVAGSGVTDMDIGFVPATNTSNPHSYTFVDQYPLNGTSTGTNFYRLRIVDLDGNITYSKYVYISCPGCTATPPLVDCRPYSIVGPSSICSGPVTYSVSSPLYYNKYTWSVDNYFYFTSPSTHMSSIQAYGGGDGIALLSLTMSRCTSNTQVIYKEVEVGRKLNGTITSVLLGTYSPIIDENTGTNYLPTGEYTSILYVNGATAPLALTLLNTNLNYWEWLPGNSGGELDLYMLPGGYAEFQVDANTDCGPKTYKILFAATGSLSYYSISPNPASSQLNVYVDDRKLDNMKLKRGFDQNIQQVIVTDKQGNTILQQKYPAGTRNINLNVAGLRTDVYTIRIFNGKKWEVLKFIKR